MAKPTVADVHINSAMSNISIAYSNETYIAGRAFPVVNVQKKSDFYFIFDAPDWFKDDVAVRAPGTRARRVDYNLTSASYVAVGYGLAKVVADEVRENADDPLRPDVEASEFVTDALLRALERRVATVITTCGNWASASNPGTLWSSDSSDPVTDIENLKDAITGKIGRAPNSVVMGQQVWTALRKHPDLLDRVKYVERGVLNPAAFKDIFGVDRLLIGTAIYNSAVEDAAASYSYIWGKHLWMGYVPAGATLMTPAAGYILEWGARTVRQYREDQEHADVFEAQHFTAEKITASDSGGGWFTAVA